MILSTASTYPMADIRAACPAPMWFQLYCNKDPGITQALVDQAHACGFAAIVVTVDLPVLGNREIADRTGLPKATISRLTYTLVLLGYLSRDAALQAALILLGVILAGLAWLPLLFVLDPVG